MQLSGHKNLLLYILFFLMMFSVILGDNISETFLLTYHSTSTLSIMFIVNAVVLFLVSVFTISAVDKVHRFKLFLILTGVIVGFLTLSWIGMLFQWKGIALGLFVVAYTGKILLFLTYWTMANDLCDSREAKTVFPLIGASGVVGALGANFSTAYLSPKIGPHNLIILWAGLLMLSLVLVKLLNLNFPKEFYPKSQENSQKTNWGQQLKSDVQFIYKEPFLKTMSAIYFLMFLMLISLDFHFFSELKVTLLTSILQVDALSPSSVSNLSKAIQLELGTQISGFLGMFRGVASSVTLFIQFFIAGKLLKKLGTARSMFIMPAAFTLIFFVAFLEKTIGIFPENFDFLPLKFSGSFFIILLAGTFIRIGLFDSLFSPNFQIFFSSLPAAIRGRSKLFLEGLAKPAAILLAGLSVLGVSNWIFQKNPSLIWIHFLCLFVLGIVLLFVVWKLQRQYTNSISGFLGGYRAEQLNNILKLDQAKNADSILKLLTFYAFDSDKNIRILAVETLSQIKSDGVRDRLLEIAQLKFYPNRPDVIIALFQQNINQTHQKYLEEWMWEKDEKIVLACLEATRYSDYEKFQGILEPYIFHQNLTYSLKAITIAWDKANELVKTRITEKLNSMCSSQDSAELEQLLKTLGDMGKPELLPVFEKAKEQLENLDTTLNKFEILSNMSKFPVDSCVENTIREIQHQKEREKMHLYKNLEPHIFLVQKEFSNWIKKFDDHQIFHLIKLLYLTRTKLPKNFKPLLNDLLQENINQGRKLQAEIRSLKKSSNIEMKLLGHSIEETPLENIKRNIAHLLALLDRSGNLFFVTPKLLSTSNFEKAAALEVIDTRFEGKLRADLTNLFLNTEEKMKKSRKEQKGEKPLQELLQNWSQNTLYPWVQTCALYCGFSKESHPKKTDPEVKKFYNMFEKPLN